MEVQRQGEGLVFVLCSYSLVNVKFRTAPQIQDNGSLQSTSFLQCQLETSFAKSNVAPLFKNLAICHVLASGYPTDGWYWVVAGIGLETLVIYISFCETGPHRLAIGKRYSTQMLHL